MDHVVYVDVKAKELPRLLSGEKTMIIRGAAGRKLPHGRVHVGDTLYLVENDGSGMVEAKARVAAVLNSEKLTLEDSQALVTEHQEKLQLTEAQFKRWAGKRYLVLITLEQVSAVEPFKIDRSEYGNMDDWLPVGEIAGVKI